MTSAPRGRRQLPVQVLAPLFQLHNLGLPLSDGVGQMRMLRHEPPPWIGITFAVGHKQLRRELLVQ